MPRGRPKGSKNTRKKHPTYEEQRRKERLEAGQTIVWDGVLQPHDYGIASLSTSEQLKLFIELRDKEMNEPNHAMYAEWKLQSIDGNFKDLEEHLHNAMNKDQQDYQPIIDVLFEAEKLVRQARHDFKKLTATSTVVGEG